MRAGVEPSHVHHGRDPLRSPPEAECAIAKVFSYQSGNGVGQTKIGPKFMNLSRVTVVSRCWRFAGRQQEDQQDAKQAKPQAISQNAVDIAST